MVICQEQLDTIVPLAPVTMPGLVFFFFQAEDGIRVDLVTGVQTCALPISTRNSAERPPPCTYSRWLALLRNVTISKRPPWSRMVFSTIRVPSIHWPPRLLI